jgi:hypothetical protein
MLTYSKVDHSVNGNRQTCPDLNKSRHKSSTLAPLAQTYTGATLNRLLQKLSPAGKALVAHDLRTGAKRITELTGVQARALTSASVGYITTVARLSEIERAAVRNGHASLAAKHLGRKPVHVDVAEAASAWGEWSLEQRAEFGRQVGVAELFDGACCPALQS